MVISVHWSHYDQATLKGHGQQKETRAPHALTEDEAMFTQKLDKKDVLCTQTNITALISVKTKMPQRPLTKSAHCMNGYATANKKREDKSPI